jgi:hypothetical protein
VFEKLIGANDFAATGQMPGNTVSVCKSGLRLWLNNLLAIWTEFGDRFVNLYFSNIFLSAKCKVNYTCSKNHSFSKNALTSKSVCVCVCVCVCV